MISITQTLIEKTIPCTNKKTIPWGILWNLYLENNDERINIVFH